MLMYEVTRVAALSTKHGIYAPIYVIKLFSRRRHVTFQPVPSCSDRHCDMQAGSTATDNPN